jgi:predicted GNAT family acetyltransferase
VDIEFVDAPKRHRYELRSGADVVGILSYHLTGDVLRLIHTEVPPEHGGHGYAATLTRGALDDARSRDLTIRPDCPYVASYIEKHPEYADLVAQ